MHACLAHCMAAGRLPHLHRLAATAEAAACCCIHVHAQAAMAHDATLLVIPVRRRPKAGRHLLIH